MTDAYWFEALPKPVVLAGLSARKKYGCKSEKIEVHVNVENVLAKKSKNVNSHCHFFC